MSVRIFASHMPNTHGGAVCEKLSSSTIGSVSRFDRRYAFLGDGCGTPEVCSRKQRDLLLSAFETMDVPRFLSEYQAGDGAEASYGPLCNATEKFT